MHHPAYEKNNNKSQSRCCAKLPSLKMKSRVKHKVTAFLRLQCQTTFQTMLCQHFSSLLFILATTCRIRTMQSDCKSSKGPPVNDQANVFQCRIRTFQFKRKENTTLIQHCFSLSGLLILKKILWGQFFQTFDVPEKHCSLEKKCEQHCSGKKLSPMR